jgi:hypothetical protein
MVEDNNAGADPSVGLEAEKKFLRVFLDGEGLIMSVSAEKRDRRAVGVVVWDSEGQGSGGSGQVGGVPRRADRRVAAICRGTECVSGHLSNDTHSRSAERENAQTGTLRRGPLTGSEKTGWKTAAECGQSKEARTAKGRVSSGKTNEAWPYAHAKTGALGAGQACGRLCSPEARSERAIQAEG